jgi:ComF family protein
MTNSGASDILRDFVSLFFPKPCLGCGESLLKGEDIICTGCLLELPETDHHRQEDNSLFHRLSYRMPLRYAMACYQFTKNGRVQRLLHTLKYHGHHEIGTRLGWLYGEKLLEVGIYGGFDLVLPVPLHISRLRKRGYNQSAMFGEGLAEKLMIPCSDKVIGRLQKTDTQTRKSRANRWENIANVFTVRLPELVKDRSILLVDDVITTGSTLEACAGALLSEGVRELSIACIAEA